MKPTEIIELQRHIGANPDGFWGPKSIGACKAHLLKLMPDHNPWPNSDQASLKAFYGNPGDESQLVKLPVDGLGVRYDGQPVRTIYCHAKVAESLGRVLAAIAEGPCNVVLGEYAGCYNNRAMRGGSTPSLHARGAAIDLDPDGNGNLVPWPTVATMRIEVMEAFAREGWLSAGAFWGRDAMHFQATR